jgi:hypothetical protein
MSDSYTFTPSKPGANLQAYPLDFSKVAILGNAGAKLNRYIYGHELSPVVPSKTEGQLAPGAGIGPGILGAARSSRKLAGKLFNGFLSEAGGRGDELLPNELPNGHILTPEELAARQRPLPEPVILPMWAADP